ncbi:MAG: tRNA (guanosine(37)-N1)-methyltransferase TrmD [Parcubacteria group bacterium]
MKIDIITIFPNLFDNFLNESLIARAQKKKLVRITAHDLRKWTKDNHKTVDGKPYGGGAGMVLMVNPIMKAVNKLKSKKKKIRVISMSAKGKTFNQAMARKWSKFDQLIFICGRYEGIDERVNKYVADEEISIGNYVLFGGEIPAMVITEAVTRLIPGSIGKQESLKDESFNVTGTVQKQLSEFLEYPHYTRPETIEINGKKRHVPKVLLSGNHKEVEKWRKKQSKIAKKI